MPSGLSPNSTTVSPRDMQEAAQRIRPVMLRGDSRPGRDFDWLCRALLASNPRNRMAVEYLFAYHLLHRETWWCVDDLGLLKAAGYRKLPRHLQEAIALLDAESGAHTNLRGYELDADTRTRFAGFASLMDAARAAGDATEKAKARVAPQYGNSYFYYYAFEESGVGRR